jgi:hypothetical protein
LTESPAGVLHPFMGMRTPKSLTELRGFDADLGVRCRDCGRFAVFDAAEMAEWFARNNWPTALDRVGERFRCRGRVGTSPGCGSRDMVAFPAQRRGERNKEGPPMPWLIIEPRRR